MIKGQTTGITMFAKDVTGSGGIKIHILCRADAALSLNILGSEFAKHK